MVFVIVVVVWLVLVFLINVLCGGVVVGRHQAPKDSKTISKG